MKYIQQAVMLILAVSLSLSACTPEPKAINYGSDICHYCKMTIVDKQHAAELVTQKGKVFKFDAIECMINYQADNSEASYAYELVTDYYRPAEWLGADTAAYLISENLPSPMGAFLTAFENKKIALEMQKEKGGEVYNWSSVKQQIAK